MVPNFILTVNERSVRQKPIVGRSLKFNTTLLQITIIAKALSIELSEEHIADLLQEAVTDQRDEYRQLRKLYAEYRIGWAEILSKLGVKKWPSAPLENPDGVDEISNAYLQSRLGADNYRMFATGGEQFNEALDQLLTAVRIETDLSFHEESAPNQMQNAFEEKMMNFFQTQREHNRQVLTDETEAKLVLSVLLAIKDKDSQISRATSSVKTTVSWTFDNGTTEKLIRDGTRAIDLMKYTTKDIKTQAPVLPDFSTHPATIAWGLSTDNKYAPQNFAQDLQDFLLFKHKEWYNDPETLFHICPRTKVDHDDFQPQGKYRGVCNISMKFHDESSWLGGTGWLIDEKTVVTAAHNLYEKPTKGATRYAEVVFVTIGSSGTETQKTDKAERRRGKSAAIHLGFYSQDPNSHDAWWEKYDMAVIRLEDPFRESKCFEWRTTPLQEKDVTIEVVGYPGDLPSTADEGLIMYKAQQCIDLNLKRDGHQLSYQLDTAKGNSGSPVIRLGPNSEIKVIGIHSYGVQEAGVNMATSLGHLGNDPNFFRSALDAFENPSENGDSIVLREETLIEGVLCGKRVSAVSHKGHP